MGEKTEENARFVSEKRSKLPLLKPSLRLKVLLSANISRFTKESRKLKRPKKLKKEMDDYKHIPEIKAKKAKKASEFKGIFDDEDMDEDEDEDDMGDVERFELREDRGKKR